MPLRDVLIALVVVTLWGVNFTVIKLSVTELPPLLAAALRFVFAVVPAVFFVPRPAAPWRIVLMFGLFQGVGLYALLNMAIYLGMTASLASLVLQVQALFTILFAYFLLGERPRRLQIAGMLVALAGIGIIGLARLEGAALLPFVVIIMAAASWGVGNIASKKAGNVNMLAFTVWGNLVAPLPLFALSLVFDGPDAVFTALANPSWEIAGLIAFLAYPTTLFGFAAWSWLIKRHPTSTVAPFTLLVPIAGMLSGALILGERVETIDFIGGAVILAGLALIVVRMKRRQAPETPAG
jgi:O-acetylserine/cysteine efflux transporter